MGGFFGRNIMNSMTGGLYGISQNGATPGVIISGGTLKEEQVFPTAAAVPAPQQAKTTEKKKEVKKTMAQRDEEEQARHKQTVLGHRGGLNS